MTGILKKTSAVLAIFLTTILIMGLMPFNLHAKSDPVLLTEEIITAARNNPGVIQADVIEYNVYTDEDVPSGYEAGSGFFTISGSVKLETDITLTKESIFIDGGANKEILFDLNGHTIDLVSPMCVGGVNYEAVVCDSLVTIADSSELLFGTIRVADAYFENCDAIGIYNDTIITGGAFFGYIYNNNYDDVELTVEDGLFGGPIYIQNLTVKDGNFFKYVYVRNDADISDGAFYGEVTVKGNLTIEKGTFSKVNAYGDCLINDGGFDRIQFGPYGDGVHPDVVINGGMFVHEDSNSQLEPTMNIQGANVTINNALIVNLLDSDDLPICNGIVFFADDGGSLTINEGTITSGEKSVAVLTSGVGGPVNINGGYFMGDCSALLILPQGDDIPDVKIKGGAFAKYNPAIEDFGAITIHGNSNFIDKDAAEYLNSLLADGYCYTPNLIAKNSGYIESLYAVSLYTQDEICVKAPTVNPDGGRDELTELFDEMLAKALSGEAPEGMSPELCDLIVLSIEQGKTISVGLNITEKSAEELAEDAEIVNSGLSGNQKIAGYFDINIEVSADGELLGYITKLDKGILLSIPLTNGAGDVPLGMERTFKLARVHEGELALLDASREGDMLKSYSDLYSTYAIVYEDSASATPTTGDFNDFVVYTSVALLMLGGLAALIVSKRSEEN